MPVEPGHGSAPSLTFRRIRALVLGLAVIGVVALGVHLVRGGKAPAIAVPATGKTATSAETAPATSDPASGAPATTPTAPTAGPTTSSAPASPSAPTSASAAALLGEAVKSDHVSGRLSVAVTDLDTGLTASYGAKDHFATASIVKVDILATLLLQHQGDLSSSQRSLATRMIEQSDNNAASGLWNQIGRAEGLEEANEQFGLTETTGGKAGYWGTTTTTSTDQLRLLQMVFTDDGPLNAESRRYLKGLMADVENDQDWGVPAADTRSGEHYYVKNGWLPRSTGWVINSIGSVDYHGHPLLIAALSDRSSSMPSAVDALEDVSKKAAAAATGS